MFNPLRIVRNAYKAAALGGLQDALDEMHADETALIVQFRQPAIADQPAAAVEDETPAKARKGKS